MSRVATVVPEESDLLCEGCGYTLNGLPTSGNCPECGKPIDQSVGEHRNLSAFERAPSVRSFLATTRSLLFSPRRFYGTITTRNFTSGSLWFARIHLVFAALLFSAAAVGHIRLILDDYRNLGMLHLRLMYLIMAITIPPAIFGMLQLLTALAAWLSAIESRYWGMRLPYRVVMRGLLFHRAHYLPVGFLAAGIVWAYRGLLMAEIVTHNEDMVYLYTLCGAVLVSAAYLFNMYWIAMKSMMYANR